jgi:hypothetical protein
MRLYQECIVTTLSTSKGLLGFMKKRRLLNEKEVKPELCLEYGEQFLAQGWWEDALEFFRKAGDTAGLDKIKEHCLQDGDAYLLGRLGLPQTSQTWRQLGDRALELGKLFFARRAYELAGEGDKTAMVDGLIAGAGASELE